MPGMLVTIAASRLAITTVNIYEFGPNSCINTEEIEKRALPSIWRSEYRNTKPCANDLAASVISEQAGYVRTCAPGQCPGFSQQSVIANEEGCMRRQTFFINVVFDVFLGEVDQRFY